ncbi:CRISPR system precrRNA processing endoribonuclease RAMP protein Cas6 [bacterium]|nr:CRISPR system precrRNA processing endoribonuclease RAMP protein Cas6 [bacterium]
MMTEQRLYAIVLRLAAIRPGAIPDNHGDQARAALMKIIQHADSPLAQRLHDSNTAKPYTISLVKGGHRRRHGGDMAQHFGEASEADWRFTLLIEPAFEALLRRYLLDRHLPHVRIGAVEFAIADAFASGAHPQSGHISVTDLTDRWNIPAEQLKRTLTLDFQSPTSFSLGQDPETRQYRFRATPDPKTMFSALRKRWALMGGVEPGDVFDEWVGRCIEAEPMHMETCQSLVERRRIPAFMGRVRFRQHGADVTWLPLLHLLADLSFWTGAGYQTTRGMGQVRRLE